MLKTSFATLDLDCCIYNASGPRTGSVEALEKIAQSKAGAILSKSATLLKQDGNPLPRFINKIDLGETYCEGSLNSEGLPNYGIDYYISEEALSKMKTYNKPYIVSISGHTLKDNMAMLENIYSKENISAIELNFACPNVPGKPMIGYDFDQLDNALDAIVKMPSFDKIPLGVKLPPYFDIPHFEKAASIISKYPVKFIVSVNTIGNALVVDYENECEGIVPKQGLGGLAGGFIKHTALANVRTMYNLLIKNNRPDIDIIGVGGVASGKDAFELILCGAKAIQVGTCHWTEGASCFQRIANELEAIMAEKNYKTIEDFRGKLKPFIKSQKKLTDKKEKTVENKSKTSSNEFSLLNSILVAIIAIQFAYIVYISSLNRSLE